MSIKTNQELINERIILLQAKIRNNLIKMGVTTTGIETKTLNELADEILNITPKDEEDEVVG